MADVTSGFRWVVYLALSVTLLLPSITFGTEVESVLQAGADKTRAAQRSQQKIDRLADDTYDIFQDFQVVNKQLEGLRIYNAQLTKQIENQQQSMQEIEDSIENATVIERQITPLSIKMLDALEQFIQLDLPFQKDIRMDNVARVRANLDATRFSSAEKFRQVLELYDIEAEYGGTIDQYSGLLPINDQERQVTFLRVGRIALLYQTADQVETGVWNPRAKEWQVLPSGEYRSAVSKAVRIAKKQAAIDILNLPVFAPEAAQ